MPASRPTEKVRADDWLPGEWIEVLTYAGAAVQEQLGDALTRVTMDPATMQMTTTTYTPGHALTERRRLAVVDWCLFEETEPGKAGAAIPFTPENLANLDPAYALWLDTKIRELWARWRTATGQSEDARERKTFQPSPSPVAGGESGQEDALAVAGSA